MIEINAKEQHDGKKDRCLNKEDNKSETAEADYGHYKPTQSKVNALVGYHTCNFGCYCGRPLPILVNRLCPLVTICNSKMIWQKVKDFTFFVQPSPIASKSLPKIQLITESERKSRSLPITHLTDYAKGDCWSLQRNLTRWNRSNWNLPIPWDTNFKGALTPPYKNQKIKTWIAIVLFPGYYRSGKIVNQAWYGNQTTNHWWDGFSIAKFVEQTTHPL